MLIYIQMGSLLYFHWNKVVTKNGIKHLKCLHRPAVATVKWP